MKTIETIIIALALLTISNNVLAENPHFGWTSQKNVKYKGENYTIFYGDDCFSIQNKKYQFLYNTALSTLLIPLPGEYEMGTIRRAAALRQKLDSLAYSGVFTPEQTLAFLDLYDQTYLTCFFEAETNDYVGVLFQFDNKYSWHSNN